MVSALIPEGGGDKPPAVGTGATLSSNESRTIDDAPSPSIPRRQDTILSICLVHI